MRKILVFLALTLIILSPVFCQSSSVTIKYYGTFTLKIISREGQGKTLLGISDSIDNSKPRTCIIQVQKNADLVIDFVILEYSEQNVLSRAEIRKHINNEDSIVEITDSDVKMLTLYETAQSRIRVEAKDYQVFFEDSRFLLSRIIPLPIGQSYLQIAYKDPKGVFYSLAFLPVTVSESGGDITITADDLAKSVKVSNW